MFLELTEEQRLIRDTARSFAAAELAPLAARLDREGGRPAFIANLKKLAQLGFMGLDVSAAYGGSEAGGVAFSVAMTEIARACASTAVTVSVNNMVCEVIEAIGSQEQKERYIPCICSGDCIAASFALTEPGAGSDPAAMITTARRDGDHFVLDGTKAFITSAPYAGIFVVWAVTDRDASRGEGISCFLVEPGTAGLIIGREEDKSGQRASATCSVTFEACRIPASALMGELNRGFKVAVGELAGGRIGIGSLALGLGLAAMDFATSYAAQRSQFGQKISKFEGIRFMIADAYTELEAARLLLMQAAYRKEAGKSFAKEASMAKLYATEAANRACYKAVQMLGGYGYLGDFPVERYARDVRVTTIYEGTSEIQRLIISRAILESLS